MEGVPGWGGPGCLRVPAGASVCGLGELLPAGLPLPSRHHWPLFPHSPWLSLSLTVPLAGEPRTTPHFAATAPPAAQTDLNPEPQGRPAGGLLVFPA